MQDSEAGLCKAQVFQTSGSVTVFQVDSGKGVYDKFWLPYDPRYVAPPGSGAPPTVIRCEIPARTIVAIA